MNENEGAMNGAKCESKIVAQPFNGFYDFGGIQFEANECDKYVDTSN